MSKSMKITRAEMCECGKAVGFDGTKVYDWLDKNSVVVGRGRPSKSKVVEQDSESEDLFASLVKSHGGGAPVNPPTADLEQQGALTNPEPLVINEEEKAGEKEAKAAEKEAKAAEKEAKAAEKVAKLAEKEAKKQEIEDVKAAKLAEKEAKEQEKAAKLAEKEAKSLLKKENKTLKASKEQDKILEKEAKSLLKKENKTLKEPKAAKEPKATKAANLVAEGVYGGIAIEEAADLVPKVGEEEDSVMEMVYEGKKYLKSVISGVVYDMDENEIGAWKNDKIVLNDSSGSEEEEEEYTLF